jgi:hypothetical protein
MDEGIGDAEFLDRAVAPRQPVTPMRG